MATHVDTTPPAEGEGSAAPIGNITPRMPAWRSVEGGEDLVTSRRRLLFGLAAASTAVTVTGATALAAVPAEDPELLRIAAELPGLVQAYHDAAANAARLRREGFRRWPTTPDALFKRTNGGAIRFVTSGVDAMEKTFADGARFHPGEEHPRAVYARWEATGPYERAKAALASPWMARNGKLYGVSRSDWARLAEEARPLAEVAETYYDECDRIRDEVGWSRAWPIVNDRARDLATAISAIMKIEARTMEGAIIKAQALDAWADVDWWATRIADEPAWARSFARDILRLSGARA